MIGINSKVERSKEMPWRMIEEEAILVDVDKSEVIYLNEVSAFIWKLIEEKGPIVVSDIVENICKTFEIEKKVAELDVIEFLKDLAAKEVISY